jgi:UDP-N-acetyl-D-glucosamine dehydrogenase
MGVAYKKNIDDVRESPALDILMLLRQRGANVTFSDPFVPEVRLDSAVLSSVAPSVAAQADCVVIVTDHDGTDYATLVKQAKLIVDTRNALKSYRSDNIVRL